jgi:hypothetical protein
MKEYRRNVRDGSRLQNDDSLANRLFSGYYIPPATYDQYLTMYGLNKCMFKDIEAMVDRQEWETLNQINDASYCCICGIKKKRKVRHCPNVGKFDCR